MIFTDRRGAHRARVLVYLVDVRKFDRWARPFEIFGRNAIVAYVGSGAMARLLTLVKVGGPDGSEVSLQKRLYEALYASWLPDYWSSFAWALSFVLLWLAIVWILDRRGILIRIRLLVRRLRTLRRIVTCSERGSRSRVV